ncbi:flavin reductase family protein [Saccharopolyspora sp. MS10]|uniref:flavin reductase family protein n=1 Tax=Saccharopolyspora sp. MS10 TaxID=3385973 RepID=UPI0039A2A29C
MTITTDITDSRHYRDVMGRLPTSVVVVAGRDAETGTAAGLVVGTFQSLSLDPPLVCFSVAETSGSWPRVRAGGLFSASVLTTGQDAVCRALSSKSPDKFAAVDWFPSPDGSPRISGAHAWIDCELCHEWTGGDHRIVIARVRNMVAGDGEGTGPLVFYRGRLGGYREPAA